MPTERSEWTVDTLKEHLDELRKADQEAVKLALAGQAASKTSVISIWLYVLLIGNLITQIATVIINYNKH